MSGSLVTSRPLDTPVALIIFNRPSTTQAVLDAIAMVQPRRLFVIADGPRCASDLGKCAKARAVVDSIGWACEAQKDYAERNLGCRDRVVSGLNWLFSQVEEAIILEDDCVPTASFFGFCETLLNRYRHEERVMEIGGCNFQSGRSRTPHSYYFSRYAHTWGWATWKRAWAHFDPRISAWPELKRSDRWPLICGNEWERAYWSGILDEVFAGSRTSCWDYQWQLARWCQGGLAAVPDVNMVSNIGYGPDATHTREVDSMAAIERHEMLELRHPPAIVRHAEADTYMFENFLAPRRVGAMRGWTRIIRQAVLELRRRWPG